MIYFYVYPSAFQNPGGGEILLLKTKEYLEKLGVEVQLFNQWEHRFNKTDLLHVFGSVKEALGVMTIAKSKGVKIVHTPVIWYNWQSSLFIPYNFKERILCILRQTAKTCFPLIPSERKMMMQLADVVLGSSKAEADQIARYFLIPRDKIRVAVCGTDECYEETDKQIFIEKYGLKNFVLMVGRIEPRKNQLNLIRAMKSVDKLLVIIGETVSNHQAYYERCRKEAKNNVFFLGSLAMGSEELRSAYSACELFALPTWFETPGIAALEAGLSGAKIVITREGATREYFKDFVEYANPLSAEDITRNIKKALNRQKTGALKDFIKKNYLWQNTAEQTLEAYRAVGYSAI